MWKEDHNGKILNVPEGGFDHHMDGIRYAIGSYVPLSFYREQKKVGLLYLNKEPEVKNTSYE